MKWRSAEVNSLIAQKAPSSQAEQKEFLRNHPISFFHSYGRPSFDRMGKEKRSYISLAQVFDLNNYYKSLY